MTTFLFVNTYISNEIDEIIVPTVESAVSITMYAYAAYTPPLLNIIYCRLKNVNRTLNYEWPG